MRRRHASHITVVLSKAAHSGPSVCLRARAPCPLRVSCPGADRALTVQQACRRERAVRAAGLCASVVPWVKSVILHIISVRPSKQHLMVRTFLKVYMELGSYFLFLQEEIKDIIINHPFKFGLRRSLQWGLVENKRNTHTLPSPTTRNLLESLSNHISKSSVMMMMSFICSCRNRNQLADAMMSRAAVDENATRGGEVTGDSYWSSPAALH